MVLLCSLGITVFTPSGIRRMRLCQEPNGALSPAGSPLAPFPDPSPTRPDPTPVASGDTLESVADVFECKSQAGQLSGVETDLDKRQHKASV